jgi:hypothetical protein
MGVTGRIRRGLTGVLDRTMARRWARAAEVADRIDMATLASLRHRAATLRDRVDHFARAADGRLATPPVGSNAIAKPLHTDWAYRPEPWRMPVSPTGQAAIATGTRIGSEATVFHDCAVSEITYRQLRNRRDSDIAPFAMRVDVFHFEGSFLSLVLDLPQAGIDGLKKRHLIRVATEIEVEKPLEVFARLNIQHGPNSEQFVREVPGRGTETWVDFDLAYSELNEKRISRMWLDLIFDAPDLNQIILRDLTVTRRPRADL